MDFVCAFLRAHRYEVCVRVPETLDGEAFFFIIIIAAANVVKK